jgi:hypothetical protein
MNSKLSIPTTQELFRLRDFLQRISHISFSFSKLNQSYPLDTLDEKEAEELRMAYINLIEEAGDIVSGFNDLYGKPTD